MPCCRGLLMLDGFCLLVSNLVCRFAPSLLLLLLLLLLLIVSRLLLCLRT